LRLQELTGTWETAMSIPGLLAVCLVMILAAGTRCGRENRVQNNEATGGEWELVLEEEFYDRSCLDRWRLEGFADLNLGREEGVDYIEITTRRDTADHDNRQSVLWCNEPFRGDLRFEFRARGETSNRSIFYFNANPVEGFDLSSIFDWLRPDAQMLHYAGCDSIEMYSVGILRDDQQECNLRYIGGTTAPAYRNPEMMTDVQRLYGDETIFKAFPSPFLGRPDTWFEFDLQVESSHITLKIDGKIIIDLEDPQDVGTEKFAWISLTDGGWFGFRNFVPGKVCYDHVRVYKRR